MSDQVPQSGGELRVTVEPGTVEVAPGAVASVDLRVGSTAVEPVDVAIDALGPHAAWCEVRPPRLQIGANEDAPADITIRVPDGLPPPAAPIVVGLRATASRPEVLSHVGELHVQVPVTTAMQLDIVPSVQRVSGRARFAAVVRNDGDAPLRVRLTPGDAAPEVMMRVRPATVQVQPRSRSRTAVTVWSPPQWTGDEPDYSFTVRADAGGDQIEAVGSFVQRTRAGTALVVFGGGLFVMGLALLVLLIRAVI